MTPAEYRTVAESLGITQSFLAEHTGVTEGRVWTYGSPSRKIDVPERAADVLEHLAVTFDNEVARIVGNPVSTVVRHTDVASFHEAHPALVGWPLSSEGALLGAAMAASKGALTVVYP